MPWIIKTTAQLPDGGSSVEYFGSGLTEKDAALGHVQQLVPGGEVSVVRSVTDAELSEYGVPQGRTEMISFNEEATRK
jgi:hypothetical protein